MQQRVQAEVQNVNAEFQPAEVHTVNAEPQQRLATISVNRDLQKLQRDAIPQFNGKCEQKVLSEFFLKLRDFYELTYFTESKNIIFAAAKVTGSADSWWSSHKKKQISSFQEFGDKIN
ncbi:unnamed protein product [Rotaria socialis]|uniref:DUF4939 domain-containing protein n=1 Tax=Rotaria socialis TaxID=392032 RepID=A0A818QGB7_9BILA|nr:unnamed protein product [Rotaria socialis]